MRDDINCFIPSQIYARCGRKGGGHHDVGREEGGGSPLMGMGKSLCLPDPNIGGKGKGKNDIVVT